MADTIFIIILASAAFLLVNVLATAYIAYRRTFYNNPKKHPVDPYRVLKKDSTAFKKEYIDNILAQPYENIYIKSHDGLSLRARLYMHSDDAPFAIQCHGYHSSPMIDFCGGGPLAMRLGFNVIMIDQRAHGESEGNTISFGANESADVVGWVNYVREHYGADREVMLQGVSMGAATVLLASCRDDLPDNVVCTLADCPFSSAKKIVTKVMKDMKISARIIYPLAHLGARIFGGFDPDTADAERVIKNLKVPLVLIHGEADDFVPCDMSRELQKASGGKITLHTVPGAAHGVSYLVDMPAYEAIVIDFCKKHLKSFGKQAEEQ